MKKMDFHTHILNDITIDETVSFYQELCERKGYEGIGILACSHTTEGDYPDCNEMAMAVRNRLPNSYAFAALHHDRDFVEQAKEYMARGFEGIKILEGKPTQYRYYGYGLDHPRFEAFFAYAEEQGIPLLIHNNDPLMHWDITKMSARSIRKGW